MALASVAQLVGASSCNLKGCRFDSQSGHMPRLRVWSLVRALVRGNQSMSMCVCLYVSLSLSSPLSLLSPLSKISKHVLG